MPRSRKPGSNRPRLETSELRIIAGQWRGRKLRFPVLDGLRPTGDRLRETLFNWLAPDIEGARCMDLFAGSGALGLEALSRGAEHCCFVDTQLQACKAISSNLELLGSVSSASVVCDSAAHFLAQHDDYDTVFFDPPFAAEECYSWLAAIRPGCLVYVETARGYEPPVPDSWQSLKDKTAGAVRLRLFRS